MTLYYLYSLFNFFSVWKFIYKIDFATILLIGNTTNLGLFLKIMQNFRPTYISLSENTKLAL